ncbi:unnamed protein product [Discula destructiva]
MSDVEDNEHVRDDSPIASPMDTPPAAADADDDDDNNKDDDGMSDHDSDQLSDVDVDDLEDYDPLKANIETRPVEIDEDVAKSLKAVKRKRADGDAPSKKPKEGRRQKKRRTAGEGDDEVSAADGTIIEGKRRRPGAAEGGGEKRSKARSSAKASPAPENDENLTPEQRRARAIEKAMDAAMKGKKSTRRSKKDDIDLEEELDELIADVKTRMEKACETDNEAVSNFLPAVQKVKMLPEVMALLNRQNIQHAVLDPETNFLQSVKFFLEPLSNDGQLPAYNIQREIFTALTKMQIEKEALLSSGIGRIVLFYTKTKRAQPEIKRMAERLMGEWSRPILKRTDDYKKRMIDSRVVDTSQLRKPTDASKPSLTHRPSAAAAVSSRGAKSSVSALLADRRAKMLEPVDRNPNRARPVGAPQSYTVAPVSTVDTASQDHRPVGASGMEAFRKMTQKGKKRG